MPRPKTPPASASVTLTAGRRSPQNLHAPTSSPSSSRPSKAKPPRASPAFRHSPPEPSASSPTTSSASIENLPTLAADELHVPDAHLMFFDEVLAFDHVRKAIHIIITAVARQRLATSPHHHQPGAPGPDSRTRAATAASVSTTTAYATSLKRLDRLERLLNAAIPARKSPRPATQVQQAPQANRAHQAKGLPQSRRKNQGIHPPPETSSSASSRSVSTANPA